MDAASSNAPEGAADDQDPAGTFFYDEEAEVLRQHRVQPPDQRGLRADGSYCTLAPQATTDGDGVAPCRAAGPA